jgi:hypothetical protein
MSTTIAYSCGWLSPWLNDGRTTTFNIGDTIDFRTSIGRDVKGEIWDKGPKTGEWWVNAEGRTWLVRAKRPTCLADLKARARVRRPAKRDELGRFCR